MVNAPATTYTDAAATPGDYSYIARYFPAAGGSVDLPCSPATITVPDLNTGTPLCTAAVNASGHVELSWSTLDGEDQYIVRDNGGYVATVNNALSYVDTNPTVGERSYVIRSRQAGVTTNVTCSPDPLTVN